MATVCSSFYVCIFICAHTQPSSSLLCWSAKIGRWSWQYRLFKCVPWAAALLEGAPKFTPVHLRHWYCATEGSTKCSVCATALEARIYWAGVGEFAGICTFYERSVGSTRFLNLMDIVFVDTWIEGILVWRRGDFEAFAINIPLYITGKRFVFLFPHVAPIDSVKTTVRLERGIFARMLRHFPLFPREAKVHLMKNLYLVTRPSNYFRHFWDLHGEPKLKSLPDYETFAPSFRPPFNSCIHRWAGIIVFRFGRRKPLHSIDPFEFVLSVLLRTPLFGRNNC